MCSTGTGQAELYCRIKRAGTAVGEACKGTAYKMLLEIQLNSWRRNQTPHQIFAYASLNAGSPRFFFFFGRFASSENSPEIPVEIVTDKLLVLKSSPQITSVSASH